ncbi:hypothetical protein EIP91_002860 [Steccherinum ochraceum]|uniref:Uncharacterized protein n=1 Tax=Steccherinum ochraceum TaxID=92696 RepID=A0A4R0RV44_9APHY|nr:hypothetical protein EIP91_002860 [Steccherinum ochraceum]
MRLTVAFAALVAVASTAGLAAPLSVPVPKIYARDDFSPLILRDVFETMIDLEKRVESKPGRTPLPSSGISRRPADVAAAKKAADAAAKARAEEAEKADKAAKKQADQENRAATKAEKAAKLQENRDRRKAASGRVAAAKAAWKEATKAADQGPSSSTN